MNDLALVGLNPSARLTDTFTAPEVRLGQGAADGKSLGELAQALSQFNDRLQTVGGAWVDQANHDLLKKGAADAAKFRLQNVQDLKAAVDRGDIRESDNPWYMVGINQSLAQVQTRQAMNDFQVWYDSSPEAAAVRAADNPAAVDAAIDQRVGPLLKGFTTYQIESALPELQQFKQSMTQAHLRRRSEERVQERQTLEQMNYRSLVSGLDKESIVGASETGDPLAVSSIKLAADRMQARFNENGLTMSKSDNERAAVSAVFEQATYVADPRLARQVLSAVKSDGNSLADLYADHLADHEDRMQVLMVRKMDQQIRLNKTMLEDRKNNLMVALASVPPEQQAQAFESLPIADRVALANQFNAYGKDVAGIQKTGIETLAIAETLRRFPTQSDYERWVLSEKGVGEYLSSKDKSGWIKQTPPEVRLAILDHIQQHEGSMSFEFLDALVTTHAISESDFNRYAELVPDVKTKANPFGRFAGLVTAADNPMESRIVAALIKNAEISFTTDSRAAGVIPKLGQAREEYLRAAQEFIKTHPDLTMETAQAGLEGLADWAVRRVGGMSPEELVKFNTEKTDTAKWDAFVASNKPVPITQVHVDPSRPNVFTVEGWGVEKSYTELPLMFASAAEFNSPQFQRTAYRQLGLTNTKDQEKFMASQRRLLKAAGLIK